MRYRPNFQILVTGKKYSKTGIRQGFAKYMVKNPCVSERPYKLAVRIFEYFLPGTSTMCTSAVIVPLRLAGIVVCTRVEYDTACRAGTVVCSPGYCRKGATVAKG